MKKKKKREFKFSDWFNFTYVAMIVAIIIFVRTGHEKWAYIITGLMALSYIISFLIYLLIHTAINVMLKETEKRMKKLMKIKKELDEKEDAGYY